MSPRRDTLSISIINSLTSILAGFVIFSAIGYMSYLQGIPVSELAVDGETKNKWRMCVCDLFKLVNESIFKLVEV